MKSHWTAYQTSHEISISAEILPASFRDTLPVRFQQEWDEIRANFNAADFEREAQAFSQRLVSASQIVAAQQLEAVLANYAAAPEIRRAAQRSLSALNGVEASGERTEYLLRRLAEEATDYRTLAPMVAAGAIRQLSESLVLSRLARIRDTGSWLASSRSAQGVAKVFGLAGESMAFVAGARVSSGGPAEPWARDVAQIALSLGTFKIAGGAARRYFPGNETMRHGASLLGLLAVHPAERALGLRDANQASGLIDVLGSWIVLSVSSHLSGQVLGNRLSETRDSILERFGPRGSLPFTFNIETGFRRSPALAGDAFRWRPMLSEGSGDSPGSGPRFETKNKTLRENLQALGNLKTLDQLRAAQGELLRIYPDAESHAKIRAAVARSLELIGKQPQRRELADRLVAAARANDPNAVKVALEVIHDLNDLTVVRGYVGSRHHADLSPTSSEIFRIVNQAINARIAAINAKSGDVPAFTLATAKVKGTACPEGYHYLMRLSNLPPIVLIASPEDSRWIWRILRHSAVTIDGKKIVDPELFAERNAQGDAAVLQWSDGKLTDGSRVKVEKIGVASEYLARIGNQELDLSITPPPLPKVEPVKPKAAEPKPPAEPKRPSEEEPPPKPATEWKTHWVHNYQGIRGRHGADPGLEDLLKKFSFGRQNGKWAIDATIQETELRINGKTVYERGFTIRDGDRIDYRAVKALVHIHPVTKLFYLENVSEKPKHEPGAASAGNGGRSAGDSGPVSGEANPSAASNAKVRIPNDKDFQSFKGYKFSFDTKNQTWQVTDPNPAGGSNLWVRRGGVEWFSSPNDNRFELRDGDLLMTLRSRFVSHIPGIESVEIQPVHARVRIDPKAPGRLELLPPKR